MEHCPAPENTSTQSKPEKNITWILGEFENLDSTYKREAMDVAVSMQKEITPYLLNILSDLAVNPEKYLSYCEHDHTHEHTTQWSHIYAVTLLSHFREKRAHTLIAQVFALDPEVTDELWGDMITEDLAALLYSTYPGSPEIIQKLILNKNADSYVRSSAAESLAYCVAGKLLDRHDVLEFLSGLFNGNEVADEEGDFYSHIACVIRDLHPGEHMDLIRDAFARGLISPDIVDEENFNETTATSIEDCMAKIQRHIELRLPKDVHRRLEWWAAFHEDTDDEDDNDEFFDDEYDRLWAKAWPELYGASTPIVRSEPKIGRNDPCPCGSGKKYKKCCLQ